MDPTGETHHTPPSRQPAEVPLEEVLEVLDAELTEELTDDFADAEASPSVASASEAVASEAYEDDSEATVGEHPLAAPAQPATLAAPGEPAASEDGPRLERRRVSDREKPRRSKKKKPKPEYIERAPADISDKVAWGGGAGLIVAGLLSYLEAYTGVPTPEGLDQYAVALVMIAVSYFKKDRA